MHGSMIQARNSGVVNGATPSQMASLITQMQRGAGLQARRDSVGEWRGPTGRTGGHAMREWRKEVNARRFDTMLRGLSPGGRLDAFNPQAGFHLAGDLEHIHSQVMREQFPLLSAMEIFTMDTTVPVGATSFRARRIFEQGEAEVHSHGSSRVARVNVTQQSEDWPIHWLTAGYGWDIFEAASDDFANSNRIAELTRVARDAILRLANKIWWGLDDAGRAYNMYGVLDHPWLDRVDIALGASRDTIRANPQEALDELHRLVNFPAEDSNDVLSPTDLVMPSVLHNTYTSTRLGDATGDKIMKSFLEDNPYIKKVHVAHELLDAGGPGIHGVLAFRNDERGIRLVMPQGVTQLPAHQVDSLNVEIVNTASIGGTWMPDPKNQILGLFDTNR